MDTQLNNEQSAICPFCGSDVWLRDGKITFHLTCRGGGMTFTLAEKLTAPDKSAPPTLAEAFERFAELSVCFTAGMSIEEKNNRSREWVKLKDDIRQMINRESAFADLATDAISGHLAGRTETPVNGTVEPASTRLSIPSLSDLRDVARRQEACGQRSEECVCSRPAGHRGLHVAHSRSLYAKQCNAVAFWGDGRHVWVYDDICSVIDPDGRCEFTTE